MKTISKPQARHIVLSAQGLTKTDSFGLGLDGTIQTIKHLGYIQIDTISVVERAHNHVLWSRVSDYQAKFLTQLMEDKKVFEYWSHAASFLPMEDFRFSLPRKRIYASGKKHWFAQTPEHLKLRKKILARIKSEGPLAAKDFENTKERIASGWWDWKPAKQVLEQLFMEGELMVASRKGFQKLYDLTQRVLPNGVDTKFPNPKEHARHLILRSATANGIIRADEIAYQRSSLRKLVEAECKLLFQEKILEEIKIEGIEHTYYIPSGFLEKALNSKINNELQILSPFDNQVIQRKRLKELFGFDYTIECYVPQQKRKYGYFSLPLLKGDQFIGRIDAKAERAQKKLVIKSFHSERGVGRKSEILKAANNSFHEFALFNGCDQVKIY